MEKLTGRPSGDPSDAEDPKSAARAARGLIVQGPVALLVECLVKIVLELLDELRREMRKTQTSAKRAARKGGAPCK